MDEAKSFEEMRRAIHAVMDGVNTAISTSYERLWNAHGSALERRAGAVPGMAGSGSSGTPFEVAEAARARLLACRVTLAAARARIVATRRSSAAAKAPL